MLGRIDIKLQKTLVLLSEELNKQENWHYANHCS
jgi:hypothetical protein